MTNHHKKHTTAIRRNTELHALVFGQIVAEQERAALVQYKRMQRARSGRALTLLKRHIEQGDVI